MASLGEFLKSERESRGILLEDIAKETKISLEFLTALERDEFTGIPGEIFVIGFIRNYSKYIGINEEDAVNLYKTQKIEDDLKLDKIYQMNLKKRVIYRKSFWSILTIVFILVIIILFSIMRSANINKNIAVKKVVNSAGTYPVAVTYPMPVSTYSTKETVEVKNEKPKKGKLFLILKAEGNNEKVWLGYCYDEICKLSHDKWQSIFLKEGQRLKIEGKDIVGVIAGDAGFIRLYLNNKDIGVLGKKGEVRTKIFRNSK